MKILVINSGSSSIKYKLFDMEKNQTDASGLMERIGEKKGLLTHKIRNKKGDRSVNVIKCTVSNHKEGLEFIANLLADSKNGVIRNKSEITAVGHRVVHGGETFQKTTVINDKVIEAINKNTPLAPLHNPPNLAGIDVAKIIFPKSIQVAVFDTAFHHSMPEKAYIYALPYELYEKKRVRRYGFHGTSHAYISDAAAKYMGGSPENFSLITIHLGNGASMAAVKNGKSIDTTMGMTPLEGLVMGSRSGDIDPAIPFYLADYLGMSFAEIDVLLNKKSGLKGICGSNDMREVIEKKNNHNSKAILALDIYTYRIKKYIGAYFAAMGSLDAVVFTAGIGENSADVRELSCHGLKALGIELDSHKNSMSFDNIMEISTKNSPVKILVVPTNEELKIAMETMEMICTGYYKTQI